jgi:hypothetical protein
MRRSTNIVKGDKLEAIDLYNLSQDESLPTQHTTARNNMFDRALFVTIKETRDRYLLTIRRWRKEHSGRTVLALVNPPPTFAIRLSKLNGGITLSDRYIQLDLLNNRYLLLHTLSTNYLSLQMYRESVLEEFDFHYAFCSYRRKTIIKKPIKKDKPLTRAIKL